jgi:uncharacterized Fe-S cluster-containing radical SAM superfamily protein
MYEPIDLAKKIEKIVIKNNEKKYYRFRPTGFYGGIATADTVGCNLRCKFCWSSNSVWNPTNTGKFYTPENVAEKLLKISELKGYSQVRISGGEPTIGRKHLINLLENIESNLVFILETNGILLGSSSTYIEELSKFRNLHIRVCIKGINPEEFSLLTGAESGFKYQIKSLEYLKDSKISFNIALVSIKRDRQDFYNKLKELNLGNLMLEEEKIKIYPSVRNRLNKEGLLKYFK